MMGKPTAEDLATYEAEALAWCNKRRAERGKKPIKKLPKGRKMSTDSCPCAKATPTKVGLTRWWWRDCSVLDKGHLLPFSVCQFVEFFDTGYYPHLEQSNAR